MQAMLNRACIAFCASLLLAAFLLGQAKAARQSNPELARLYEDDQRDRAKFATMTAGDWQKVAPRDAARRKRAGQIMRAGGLRTGEDYERAALIYQHGDTPEDYLLAHVLAMTSVAQGNAGARWTAAATLDRFLHSVGRPQAFGTQLSSKDPFDTHFLPDSLRLDNCVPSLGDRARMMAALEKNQKLPAISPCRGGGFNAVRSAPCETDAAQAAPPAAVPQAVRAAGRWEATIAMPDGTEFHGYFHIREDSGRLSGEVMERGDKAFAMKDVTLEGNKLTFTVTTQDGAYEVRATIAGDLMTGTLTTPGGATGHIVGTR